MSPSFESDLADTLPAEAEPGVDEAGLVRATVAGDPGPVRCSAPGRCNGRSRRFMPMRGRRWDFSR